MLSISKSLGVSINDINPNKGIISLMYHRFEENKYPSTNIKMEIFLKHIEEINKSKIEFITYKKFKNVMEEGIDKNYLLLTIDDGFSSFYQNAWPVLKKKKIPFIIFISTEAVGNHGYMDWKQIKEIASSELVTIGNHSHTHEYLIDWNDNKIKSDIETSIKIFKNELGYSPNIIAYPFGEYSTNFKKIVSALNFEFAFGQHSGVIDQTKNYLELPRFPINEKYGELKRFKSLLKTLPFPYKKISPENRYIQKEQNPPKVKIEFFENLFSLNDINCYSNEGNVWKKAEINFIKSNELLILLKEKFKSERGRINCSLRDKSGNWRWLGIQYIIAEY